MAYVAAKRSENPKIETDKVVKILERKMPVQKRLESSQNLGLSRFY
ncbi:hypothetical protein HYR99_26720 [Candidatus Poribacteria bacterium]|nr:hypothetical protein [Candidatus Poribacteria bacterium]